MTYRAPPQGRGDRRLNTTNYEHPQETNLLSIERAMDYNSQGQPVLRVSDGEAGSSTVSAFGEPYAIPIVPVVQLDAIYGYDRLQMQQYTGGGGTVTYPNSKFVCSSTSTPGSYAVVRSRRFVRYRPGQGVLIRVSAMFTQGAVNTTQRVGAHNQEDGYSFGYNGTEFGILHAYNGRATVMTFSLASYTGAQNFTFVLNGVTTVVAISADQTVSQVCAQIARTTFTGWTVEQTDGSVIFLSDSVAAMNGAFSFTPSGTASGTLTTTQAGQAQTQSWTPQSSWNIDQVDGTGVSTITIDPTKFNVYQIQMQWLGVGAVTFSLQNPLTGQMMPVHRQLWANYQTDLHVRNPNFKITTTAASTGGTTPVTVTAGSWMGAVEGSYESIYYPRSQGLIKKNLAQDIIHHLISIKNPITEMGKINTREIRIQDFSVSVDSTDPVIFYMFIDSPLITGNHVFEPLANAIADVSTVTGTFTLTADTPIVGCTVGVDAQQNFDLYNYSIRIPPGMIFSLACYSESPLAKVSATLTWAKD